MTELEAAVTYLAAMREYAKAKALSDLSCLRKDLDTTNWAYRKMIAAYDNLWTTLDYTL